MATAKRPRKAQHGGKREGAGRPNEGRVPKAFRLRQRHVDLLDRLHVVAPRGWSQADVIAAGLEALDREWREDPEPREGPPAIVT